LLNKTQLKGFLGGIGKKTARRSTTSLTYKLSHMSSIEQLQDLSVNIEGCGGNELKLLTPASG